MELQPFVERYSAATGSLLLDGDDAVFYAARGSPPVEYLRAEVATVVGEGCNSVNIHTYLSLTGSFFLFFSCDLILFWRNRKISRPRSRVGLRCSREAIAPSRIKHNWQLPLELKP